MESEITPLAGRRYPGRSDGRWKMAIAVPSGIALHGGLLLILLVHAPPVIAVPSGIALHGG